MTLFEAERTFLEEELGQFPDFFSHLDSHDLAVTLDLCDRVGSAEASKRSIVDVESAELLAKVREILVSRLRIEVLFLQAL